MTEESSLLAESRQAEAGNSSARSEVHVTLNVYSTSSSSTEEMPSKTVKLKYIDGLALVLGLQIGSGIFSSPSVIAGLVPHTSAAILLWLSAGILVWTGATSFIELGVAVPRNGGIQEYLHHCYGDVPAFLFASFWIVVAKPCALALISLIFSEYLHRAVVGDQQHSQWTLKGAALLAILVATYVSCRGTRSWAKVANILFAVKMIGLISIVVAGFSFLLVKTNDAGAEQAPNVRDAHQMAEVKAVGDGKTLGSSLANSSDALFDALFAYGGWESVSNHRLLKTDLTKEQQISFVVGELYEPTRTLPSVLNSSMAIIVTLFTLVTSSLYLVLSIPVSQNTNAIAVVCCRLRKPGSNGTELH